MDSFSSNKRRLLLSFLMICNLQVAESEQDLSHCKALNGTTLRVVGLPLRPFLNNENGAPSGVDIDILNIFAKKLAFSYDFKATRSGGKKLANGTWTGTVAKIKSGFADIGIGPLSINAERSELVKFTTPTYILNYFFLTRKPKMLTQHFRVIEPFPLKMWLLIFMAFILIIVVFWALFKTQSKSIPVSKLSLDVLGLLLAQGYMQLIREKISDQKWVIFALLCIIFSAFVIHFYNCTLLKCLMTVQYEDPINNAGDLVRTKRPLYLCYGGSQHSLFNRSENFEFKMLYKDPSKHHRFFLAKNGGFPPDIISKITQEGAAVIADEWILRAYVQEVVELLGHNPLWLTNENIISVNRGFGVQKSSRLEQCFDPILNYLHDSGVILKIFDRNTSPIDVNRRIEVEDKTPIRMEHLTFGFVLLTVGIAMASTMFLVELKAHKRCSRGLDIPAPQRRPRLSRKFLEETTPSAKPKSLE